MVFTSGVADRMTKILICGSPEKTFEAGERLGASLTGGDIVLLYGGLGAGKTLFTKGILSTLGYDIDEVTSPSFALVNLYPAESFDVYHIDLWRLDSGQDIVTAVGLNEILENEGVVTIIEWAERLGDAEPEQNVIRVKIGGEGDEPRTITITHRSENADVAAVRS